MCVGDIDIFTASAAEHFELGGYDSLISSLQEKSEERKGTILYSNQHGCDGDRLYYDGGATSISNGEVIAQGPRFSLHDVDVIIATVNIDRGWTYRPKRHHQQQQRSEGKFLYPRVEVACNLTRKVQNSFRSAPRYVPSKCERSLPVEGEIGVGPACYLWHYLRRSGCSGFLVPLSGGIDSCSTALVVYTMCTFAFNLLRTDKQVALDIQRITGIKDWLPKSPQEFSNRILHTVYMSVSQCSTPETQSRAQRLAEQLNAHHLSMSIDSVYQAARDLLPQHTGYTPHFRGSLADDVALQNLQARSRSTTAYYFAHTLPTARHQPSTSPTPAPTCGGLVVLSSVNVEECRRGNQTKHDCSSADLSPISSLSETQVRKFVKWSRHHYSLPILDAFLDATPRAELRPSCFAPCDEKETGMTHDQLFTLARLRSQERLGPLAMFEALVVEWQGQLGARETAELVKRFWISYANNRHKMSAVTPAVHAAFCGAGDGLDRRPILYPQFEGTRVFKQIEKRVLELERSSREAGGNAVDECGNAIAVAV
ncbi:glutamine-dependent nad(+) synthetase [Stemphylium lycopersici]|nr:glutamine-dependent nad(+) synthetase [Stemphylium lycopersici]